MTPIILPDNFRTFNKVKDMLFSLPYRPWEDIYDDLDDYLLLTGVSLQKTPLVGLASILHHYSANQYPDTTLEILGGLGLYSSDLAKRYPYCQCYVSDSKSRILDIGKEYNPHLLFIDPSKIFNPGSLNAVFTSINYMVQSSPAQLQEVFEVTRSLLGKNGFMLSEISASWNPFNISEKYYSINGRVSYKQKDVLLVSACLEYNPITGLYVLGCSLWEKGDTVKFLKAFKVPYYLNSIHQIRHLAESCGLTLSANYYKIPTRRRKIYADQIELIPAAEYSPKKNMLLKFNR